MKDEQSSMKVEYLGIHGIGSRKKPFPIINIDDFTYAYNEKEHYKYFNNDVLAKIEKEWLKAMSDYFRRLHAE